MKSPEPRGAASTGTAWRDFRSGTRPPACGARRSTLESRTLGLDLNELGALLVPAGLGSPRDHALISLLAINGLRISEPLGADIDDLDIDRGE